MDRFVGLLFACNSTLPFKIDNLPKESTLFEVQRGDSLVHIGAYCLMPNHFHLLITECIDGGISKFMQKLTTAYVMYYNKKYKRTGGLFEGKFKAEHAATDRYLKYLFSYIHLNPIKLIDPNWREQGIRDKKIALDYLKNYSHSSYSDYQGVIRSQNVVIKKSSFPEYFPLPRDFQKEILDWISYGDDFR